MTVINNPVGIDPTNIQTKPYTEPADKYKPEHDKKPATFDCVELSGHGNQLLAGLQGPPTLADLGVSGTVSGLGVWQDRRNEHVGLVVKATDLNGAEKFYRYADEEQGLLEIGDEKEFLKQYHKSRVALAFDNGQNELRQKRFGPINDPREYKRPPYTAIQEIKDIVNRIEVNEICTTYSANGTAPLRDLRTLDEVVTQTGTYKIMAGVNAANQTVYVAVNSNGTGHILFDDQMLKEEHDRRYDVEEQHGMSQKVYHSQLDKQIEAELTALNIQDLPVNSFKSHMPLTKLKNVVDVETTGLENNSFKVIKGFDNVGKEVYCLENKFGDRFAPMDPASFTSKFAGLIK